MITNYAECQVRESRMRTEGAMAISEQGNGRVTSVIQQRVSVMMLRDESGLVVKGREDVWIQGQA